MMEKPFAAILTAIDVMQGELGKFLGQVDFVKEMVESVARQVHDAVAEGQLAVKAERDNLYALELEKQELIDRLSEQEDEIRNRITMTEKEHARIQGKLDALRKEILDGPHEV